MKQFMSRTTEVDEKFLKEGKKNPKSMYKDDKKEKSYIILYYLTDPETKEEDKSWEVCYGRDRTYNFIKSIINYIDLESSKVVVEGLSFDEAKNAYETMKYLSQYMDDPTFDIDEYYIPIEDNNKEQEE